MAAATGGEPLNMACPEQSEIEVRLLGVLSDSGGSAVPTSLPLGTGGAA